MRALVMDGPGRLSVAERPTPGIGADDVLIKVGATGICGSDIHGAAGRTGRRHVGQVMGHETAGTIERVGRNVVDVAAGQRVTVNPVLGCERCRHCRAGHRHECPERSVIGVDPRWSGAFAEFMSVPATAVVPLPLSTPMIHGALIEPYAVGLHAVRRGQVSSGTQVLVIGAGPIGQAVAITARQSGAIVVVEEISDSRAALAKNLGFTVSSGQQDAEADHREWPVVIDAVGSSETLARALQASAASGTVVLVGMASPTVTVDAYKVSVDERTVVGSFAYTADDFAATVVAAHPAVCELLVSRTVPLADAPAEFDRLASGEGVAKSVVVFGPST